MHAKRYLPSHFAVALIGAFLAGTSVALAAQECFPHCDYTHYYGPYDFSYIRPGLFGYPRCGMQGDCAPDLTYTTGVRRGRITVQFPRATATPRQP